MMADSSWRALRFASKAIVHNRLDLRVIGIENIPQQGPVVLAARHYHHLYDGCAILASVNRPVHILVGLDWIDSKVGLAAMTAACGAADWPIIFRSPSQSPSRDSARVAALRKSINQSVSILARGRILVMFPEGYPNIDPHPNPKAGSEAFLPFQPGFAKIAIMAAEQCAPVQIVPTGLAYDLGEAKATASLRFGNPIGVCADTPEAAIVTAVERDVAELSSHRTE